MWINPTFSRLIDRIITIPLFSVLAVPLGLTNDSGQCHVLYLPGVSGGGGIKKSGRKWQWFNSGPISSPAVHGSPWSHLAVALPPPPYTQTCFSSLIISVKVTCNRRRKRGKYQMNLCASLSACVCVWWSVFMWHLLTDLPTCQRFVWFRYCFVHSWLVQLALPFCLCKPFIAVVRTEGSFAIANDTCSLKSTVCSSILLLQ